MKELDCQRLLCPMPVIRTQDTVATLNEGDELKVICTDPGALLDIPAWCRINGHRILNTKESNDLYIIELKVSTN